MKARPQPDPRAARRDFAQQQLLEAAERVFAAQGYEGARMQDVAAAAGVALATLYGMAGSKEELYAEVHAVRGRALLEAATQATLSQAPTSAWQALLAGVRGYAEFLLARPDYLRLHLQESQPWALAPRFTTREQGELWRAGLELTRQMFRAAIDEGMVVDEDPLLLARLMIAAHQVYLGDWIAGGMRTPPADVVARMLAHIERTFAAPATPGVRARGSGRARRR